MISTPIIGRPPLVLAAALMAAPLTAQAPTVVSGRQQPVYQERVSFADLDLRQRSAQQALKRRVSHASDRVCNQADEPFPYSQLGSGSSLTCAGLTYNEVQPQITAAIERAKSEQPQLTTTLAIAGPAKAR